MYDGITSSNIELA